MSNEYTTNPPSEPARTFTRLAVDLSEAVALCQNVSTELLHRAGQTTLAHDPLRIDGYAFPVKGDPAEWYLADHHNPPHHYGLDINLRKYPRGDVELGFPIYATCNGLVIFAEQARGTSWGNLIVTMSLDEDGPIYWRYGHCEDMFVERGDFVTAGQEIATIGKGYNNRYYAHLHLDAARRLQGPGEWGNPDVGWLDPLVVWVLAGYKWEWGAR